MFNQTCYFLGPSEDKAVESSPEESEDNADEEDLSFEDSEGKKYWTNFFQFSWTSKPKSFKKKFML